MHTSKQLAQLVQKLHQAADTKQATILQGFFKTGPGQYGAGDKFLGVRSPTLRALAKEFRDLDLKSLKKIMRSTWHEERALALFIATLQYETAARKKDNATTQNIYDFYVDSIPWINNWDLVDVSAPYITGQHLFRRERDILETWVKSKHLWSRRIAVISTFYFIRQNDFTDTLKLTKKLLHDEHDLMHKACGWMLREIWKRDADVAEDFLNKYYQEMPRTMLRYAIEKLPEKMRLAYLHGKIDSINN
jgi:3-methyladenine DNA glycosylase AlkD